MNFILVRDGDTVKHYRIRQLDEGGFFIARRITFRALSDLVDHYSADSDGLCVNLRKPCSQVGVVYMSFKIFFLDQKLLSRNAIKKLIHILLV